MKAVLLPLSLTLHPGKLETKEAEAVWVFTLCKKSLKGCHGQTTNNHFGLRDNDVHTSPDIQRSQNLNLEVRSSLAH